MYTRIAKTTAGLVFLRMNASLGTGVIFLLIYGAYSHLLLDWSFILILISFFLIHFGIDCLNDVFDFKYDLKNKRMDKLIVRGVVSQRQMMYVALLSYITALIILLKISIVNQNFIVLYLGFALLLIGTLYSFPKIRLKNRPYIGYTLSALVYTFIPFTLNSFYFNNLTIIDYVYSCFIFSQFMHTLTHKDKMVLEEGGNIFSSIRQKPGILTNAFFSIASSICLFIIALLFNSPVLYVVVGINLFIKLVLTYDVWYALKNIQPKWIPGKGFIMLDRVSLILFALALCLTV